MTLIVSAVVGNWAIHASDRLVGKKPTPKAAAVEHDRHSNKTVVVCARECWVVIGYTGLAYLDGRPTDQLIAEAVSGCDDLSDSTFTVWRPPPELHYREIRNRIERKLKGAYARLPKAIAARYATSVLGAGIQRKDGRVHKVMFRATAHGDFVSSAELGPTVNAFQAFRMYAVGMSHRPTLDRAQSRIKALSCPKEELADAVRDILKNVVLDVHALAPTSVGEDVMTVVLDNESRIVRTALHLADPAKQAVLHRQAMVNGDERFAKLTTIATPFVLTPGMIYGPSVANPGGWIMSNGITFDFTGFDDDPPRWQGDAFFSAQPRKPKP